MSTASPTNNPTGRLVAEHPRIVRIAKFGWFAKGVVYAVAGFLAFAIVANEDGLKSTGAPSGSGSDQEASPTGALKTIAHTTLGPLLLWVLAIGMVMYTAWRFVSAALPGGSDDAESKLKRVGFVVSGIIYLTFAWTAIKLATSSKEQVDGNSTVTDLTKTIMDHTAGRLLIGLVGLIVIAAGAYRVRKGATDDVTDELSLGGMSHERIKVIHVLGRVGEIGRGVGIGLVGLFLVIAAFDYQSSEATGLDGALRRLATNSWGLVVVALVGAGFLAYGLFCLATFTHRRLETP